MTDSNSETSALVRQSANGETRHDVRDGMRIYWNVPIRMKDGVVLRADVFLPIEEKPYPTVLSYGCYAKGLSFQEAYSAQWSRMVEDFPGITEGSTSKYQCWELTDPERWTPDGYAVVRIDSRGAGASEGVQNLWSVQEIQDYAECVEWAAVQDWSNGNIGLLGISYYAANQWMTAALQPPHLKAIIPWEGTSDLYRELFYHGGIRSRFIDFWLPRQRPMQHGYGDRARKNPNTGESVAGAVSLSDEELDRNWVNKAAEAQAHPSNDSFYDGLATDWSRITVPFLSAANWGGQGLHSRGNFEAFTQSASSQKWLEVHGLEHWTHFYSPYGVSLQRNFFDHFLKGENNGWDSRPPVLLHVRHIDGFVERHENSWPIARTQWTQYHLDARDNTLVNGLPADNGAVAYEATGDGVTFIAPALAASTEITGPLAAKLFVSSSTRDADLFLVLRLFDPNGDEVVFRGAMDACSPVAQGWLRASHRGLDEARSKPHRPYHTHQQREPLEPGEIYELDIEIWPTSIVVPAGYRLGLTVRGNDYTYTGPVDQKRNSFHRYPSRGCGPFVHDDQNDRPPEVFGGRVIVHSGGPHPSMLLLPIIPEKE